MKTISEAETPVIIAMLLRNTRRGIMTGQIKPILAELLRRHPAIKSDLEGMTDGELDAFIKREGRKVDQLYAELLGETTGEPL
jgi:hypothetical protein